MKSKVNKPKSALGRWFNSLLLLLVSMGCYVAFYIIRVHLCGSYDCRDLKITGIWYWFSPSFILFGGLVAVVAIFIRNEVNLPSIYSDAITITIAFAMLLLLFIPFGISIELSSVSNTE